MGKQMPKKQTEGFVYAIYNKFGQRMYQYISSNVCYIVNEVLLKAQKENPKAGYHIEIVEYEPNK